MGKFFGGIGSYILTVIILLGGIGGLVYFYMPVADEPQPQQVDISPDKGFDWDNLTDGMYVKLEATNSGGYHVFEYDDNYEPINRYYLVYNYSRKTNSYDRLICVAVDSYEYKIWDDLGDQVLSPNKYLKTYTVENYVHKMTDAQFKDLRNSMLVEGIDDVDELEKLIVPYYIAPREEVKPKPSIIKHMSIGAIGLGIILLIVSILGSIFNRY